MTLIDHISALNLRRPEHVPGLSATEVEEADDLISDLVALVDAGLVTVRRQLGGPARYAAGVDLSDAA